MMKYLIKVGNGSQTPVQMSNTTEAKLFLTGLMMGDGQGVDRATNRAEIITQDLVKGDAYKDRPVMELVSDDRPVYVWTEEQHDNLASKDSS